MLAADPSEKNREIEQLKKEVEQVQRASDMWQKYHEELKRGQRLGSE